MVFGFLGGLIGRKQQADPAASLPAADADPLKTVLVDLYLVKEDKGVELLAAASIRLMQESVVFEGEAQSGCEQVSEALHSGHSGDKYVFEFSYEAIEKFRQHQADMCQWSVTIDSSTVQEFGLVFPCESSLSKFHRQLVARICEVAFQEIASAPCTLAEYNKLAQEWQTIAEGAVAHLRERSNCSEAFILVTKSSDTTTAASSCSKTGPSRSDPQGSKTVPPTDNESSTELKGAKGSGSVCKSGGSRDSATSTLKPGSKGEIAECASGESSDHALVGEDLDGVNFIDHLLCYVKVSHDEFVFPLAEQHQVQWWGSSPEGEKRLFCIKFADDALLKTPSTHGTGVTLDDCKKRGTRFIDAYSLTLAEVTTGSKLSGDTNLEAQLGYSDVFELGNDDESEGMRIKDADSDPSDDEDQFPVVARDPTREILRTRPNDMVNHLLEPGHKQSVVFRVGGGACGSPHKRDMQLYRFDTVGHHSVVATVDGAKLTIGGKRLEPSSAMLHSCEEQLVLLDESDRTSAYLMDLETQKVVAKLDTDGKRADALLPTFAGAKSTAEPTLICLTNNSIFALDTRMNGKARAQTYTYTGNQGLACGATNADGGIVVGSSKGVVRLFDGKTNQEGAYKRAKTQLNGLGDPILDVRVTKDGSWILATCATYLLLYPVRVASTKRTGFTSSLGSLKPKPFVLRLDLSDVSKYNLQNCSFKKAWFDEIEKHIFTTTNNLYIIWDFVAVKKGKTDAYQVRPIGDYIKDFGVVGCEGHQTVVMVTPCALTTRDVRRIEP